MLITRETKLAIVKKHLEDGVTLQELSEEFGIHVSNIKFYIALYRKHGESVFTNENGVKTYTREFKLKTIKRKVLIFTRFDLLYYRSSILPRIGHAS